MFMPLRSISHRVGTLQKAGKGGTARGSRPPSQRVGSQRQKRTLAMATACLCWLAAPLSARHSLAACRSQGANDLHGSNKYGWAGRPPPGKLAGSPHLCLPRRRRKDGRPRRSARRICKTWNAMPLLFGRPSSSCEQRHMLAAPAASPSRPSGAPDSTCLGLVQRHRRV